MPILGTINAAGVDNWQDRNAISGIPPVPPPPSGARTVATTLVGRAAAYTDDGVSWALSNLPSSYWFSITYGNNVFVVISDRRDRTSPGIRVATSADGVSWTLGAFPSFAYWTSIVYGAGIFVATSGFYENSNIAATSPDGITWTQQTLPVSARWFSVAYGNGTFVAVAGGPSTIAVTSPDGITWTQQTLPVSAIWQQVLYLQDRFFAFAQAGQTAVSTDLGVTWTSATTLPTLPAGHGWEDAAYSPTLGSGQGRLVVVEGFSQDSDIVAYSDDQGQTWTETTIPIQEDMSGITWNGSAFIIVCSDTNVAFTSENGITWAIRTMPGTTSWGPIASAV